MITEPTRVVGTARSCLDLFFTDSPGFIRSCNLSCPIGRTDHCTIIASIDITYKLDPPLINKSWQYERCNTEALNLAIENSDWSFLTSRNLDTSTLCSRFTEKYKEIVSRHVPVKTTKIKSNDQPWITDTVRAALKNKEKLYSTFKRTGLATDEARYRAKTAEISGLIKQAKENYNDNLYKGAVH